MNITDFPTEEYKAPQINEPVLFMSDIHIPYQNAKWMERVINTATSLGIKRLVLGGDTFDVNFASSYADNPGETFADEVEAFYDCIAVPLSRRFHTIDFLLGNHEDRIGRHFKISTPDFFEGLLYKAPKFKVYPNYYAFANGVWCGHPSGASLREHIKISQRYSCNAVLGHTHHFSADQSPDGKYTGWQVGCNANINKLKYANVGVNSPREFVNGAAIILEDGTVLPMVDKFLPPEIYLGSKYARRGKGSLSG